MASWEEVLDRTIGIGIGLARSCAPAFQRCEHTGTLLLNLLPHTPALAPHKQDDLV